MKFRYLLIVILAIGSSCIYAFEPDYCTDNQPSQKRLHKMPSLTLLTARAIARQILKQNPLPQYNPAHCFEQSLSSLPDDLQKLLFEQIVQNPESWRRLPLFCRRLEHTRQVYAICFSKDERVAITASDDENVRIWDIATGTLLRKLPMDSEGLCSVKLSHDGASLIIGGRNKVYVWSLENDCIEHTLNHYGNVWRLELNESDNLLATGALKKFIKIWDLSTGKLLTKISNECKISNFWFDTGDDRFLWIKNKEFLGHWDIQTNACLQELRCTLQKGTLAYCAQSLETIFFYIPENGTSERLIGMCDLKTLTNKGSLSTNNRIIMELAVNPQGSLLVAAASNGDFLYYDLECNKLFSQLKTHTSWTGDLIFSASGRMLGSASEDRTAVVQGVDRSLRTLEELLKSLSGSTIEKSNKNAIRSESINFQEDS